MRNHGFKIQIRILNENLKIRNCNTRPSSLYLKNYLRTNCQDATLVVILDSKKYYKFNIKLYILDYFGELLQKKNICSKNKFSKEDNLFMKKNPAFNKNVRQQ